MNELISIIGFILIFCMGSASATFVNMITRDASREYEIDKLRAKLADAECCPIRSCPFQQKH
jgi:hypothetical protein